MKVQMNTESSEKIKERSEKNQLPLKPTHRDKLPLTHFSRWQTLFGQKALREGYLPKVLRTQQNSTKPSNVTRSLGTATRKARERNTNTKKLTGNSKTC